MLSTDPSGDSPFDPRGNGDDSITPALEDIFAEMANYVGMVTRVCVPARVIEVRGNQLVDIKPLSKSRYVDGNAYDMPIVTQVPVCMPMGAGWSCKYPVAKDDAGMAIMADRSLEAWSQSNGTTVVDPKDARQHTLSDAIFIPGLYPKKKQTTDTSTDMVLSNGNAVMRLKKSGRFQLSNGANEWMDLTVQLANAVSVLCDTLGSTQTLVNTMMGPQPFLASTIALLQQQKLAVQAITQKLNTLKG